MAAKKDKRCNPRYDLHVHSIRKRLVDIDGISAKAAIDGIVKAGLLSDDSAKEIREIKFTQEKCGTDEEEGTALMFIEIEDENI